MAATPNISANHKINLPSASSIASRGKQSVRAPFKITESSINTINIVAAHPGIKQKSLFDHLIEDAEMLGSIARRRRNHQPGPKPVATKTFVISRKSMDLLNETSDKVGVPGESLIELSVQRLVPTIAKEQTAHEERKKIMKQNKNHMRQGEILHKKIKEYFGLDDIFHQKIRSNNDALSKFMFRQMLFEHLR